MDGCILEYISTVLEVEPLKDELQWDWCHDVLSRWVESTNSLSLVSSLSLWSSGDCLSGKGAYCGRKRHLSDFQPWTRRFGSLQFTKVPIRDTLWQCICEKTGRDWAIKIIKRVGEYKKRTVASCITTGKLHYIWNSWLMIMWCVKCPNLWLFYRIIGQLYLIFKLSFYLWA